MQVIQGIALADANTSSFSLAFSSSMAEAMNLTPDQVTIDKIAAVAGRRALIESAENDAEENVDYARELTNNGGVAITYTVSGINIGSASELTSLLAVAISQGTLVSSLTIDGFFGASIAKPANVLYDMSPTKKPTSAPSINGAPPLPSFGPNGIVIKVMQQAVRNVTISVIFPPRAVKDYTAGQVYCAAFKQGTVPTSTGRYGMVLCVVDIPMHICSCLTPLLSRILSYVLCGVALQ